MTEKTLRIITVDADGIEKVQTTNVLGKKIKLHRQIGHDAVKRLVMQKRSESSDD